MYIKFTHSEDVSVAVMQQSRYPVFYDKDTPIELSFPWQCSPTLLLSVFYH